MATSEFQATVRREGGVSVIEMQGEIDGFAEQALNAAYEEASAGDSGTILLSFRDVDYINSTGIALIVGLLAKARKERRGIIASDLSDHYAEIFQITRLADFMNIFPDEASALASVPAS